MIGIVIVSHGKICTSLQDTLNEILGDQPNVTSVSVNDAHSRDEQKQIIAGAIDRVDHDYGVVLASDLIGATPYNICSEISADANIRLVHGVNLPFLLSLCSSSNLPLDLAVSRALSKGQVAMGRQING